MNIQEHKINEQRKKYFREGGSDADLRTVEKAHMKTIIAVILIELTIIGIIFAILLGFLAYVQLVL